MKDEEDEKTWDDSVSEVAEDELESPKGIHVHPRYDDRYDDDCVG